MKKLLRTILLAALMSMARANSFAHDIEVKGIYYNWKNNNTELEVTYKGDSWFGSTYKYTVTIPESVEYEGSAYPVTSIGWQAFATQDLSGVSIPNSVKEIGSQAFSGCSNLSSVTIGSGIETIGSDAFKRCDNLNTVTITSTSLKFVGAGAFEDTPWYKNQPDGLIYVATVAFKIKGDTKPSGALEINEGTRGIGVNCFEGCSGLTSVTFPESLTSISAYAFKGCMKLTSLTFPEGLTEISSYAFSSCSGLTSLTLPNNLKYISSNAFENCGKLASVTIGSGSIWNEAFSQCGLLASVTLGAGVSSIGNEAFANCPTSDLILRVLRDTPPTTSGQPFGYGNLSEITLMVPETAMDNYFAKSPWKDMNLMPLSDDGGEQQKCATPTIKYVKGKFVFSCETEGVTYQWEVSNNLGKEVTGSGNEAYVIQPTLTVSVYARKAGWLKSDTAYGYFPCTILKGDVNNDGQVNVADHVELSKIIMGE